MTQRSMEISKKLFEIHMTAEEEKQIIGSIEKEIAKLKKRKENIISVKFIMQK